MRRRGGAKVRLLLAAGLALFALISYFASSEFNPITGENQRISLSPQQEVAMGLAALPKMIAEYGGLFPDQRHREQVDRVGRKLAGIDSLREVDWPFEFHLLADRNTVNAFALPGGPVFITAALYGQLPTEGALAGVLGHEIGHVVARHSAQRIAKSQLTEGLVGAVVTASGDMRSAQTAQMIGQMINMKYGREDEIQSDQLGVRFMAEAGYDPRAMISVMKILAASRQGESPPEFFSTHPNPENRIERIEAAIAREFPGGVPDGLMP
jgi:predicted Zn-dependent protease